jgi:hypothetical protein
MAMVFVSRMPGARKRNRRRVAVRAAFDVAMRALFLVRL